MKYSIIEKTVMAIILVSAILLMTQSLPFANLILTMAV